MIKVFIIHGFEGRPNGAWRGWLMTELEKKDVYACSLAMPNPKAPICSEWVKEIARHVNANKNDSIYLVGHSLGSTAILRYLESAHKGTKIKGIVLVSGPIHKTANKKIEGFLKKDFDFKKMKSKINKTVVIHGNNDAWVPVINAEITAKELNGKLIVIKNGGHLNGSSGYLTLPQCFTALIKMMG